MEVTYYTQEEGALPTENLTIPVRNRLTVINNNHAGADYQFFCRMSSDGPMVCERPVYFSNNGVCPGGHDVVGYAF